MNDNNKTQKETGAVTFLDVLGWKGIWQIEDNPVRTLQEIVEETMKYSVEISKEYSATKNELRGKLIETTVLSISDTIVLFTIAEPVTAIEIQAKICAWLLPYALKRRIPLRGAISYGEYFFNGSIMIGAAVDEAASWHESTDWIGVALSPSAYIKIRNENIKYVTEYSNIPFKRSEKNLNRCVEWDYDDMTDLEKS